MTRRLSPEDQQAVPQKRRTPERTEQAEIVKLLEMLGAKVYRIGTTRKRGDYQGTCQSPGISDLWVIWPRTMPMMFGIGMWIEVKAKNGRLRREQQQFRQECIDSNITHLVGGLDTVIAWCQQNGKLRKQA
jgi:hypothetical protein